MQTEMVAVITRPTVVDVYVPIDRTEFWRDMEATRRLTPNIALIFMHNLIEHRAHYEVQRAFAEGEITLPMVIREMDWTVEALKGQARAKGYEI